jgi:hypothetical protein
MRRRRNNGEDVGVSLFPFMAVLLCTMGTLIVLLLVITDRTRNTTDVPPDASNAEPPKFASAEDDPATWRGRNAQLAEAHEQVAVVVKDRRARLGHLENTTRELENRIVELKAQLTEQQRLSEADAEQVSRAEAEVKRLEDRAVEAARNLQEIRSENKNRPASFSIVPYEGQNSTPRKPIYIECRGKNVILQPEGIILSEDDFVIASDAGNPLATILRATREYLVTSQSLGQQQEPYPLIIVRPDAVEAYYNVRQSLQGWTTDFGYELVNQDWTLKFPPADPNLATTQVRALSESRLRQRALVAMLERRTKKNPSYIPGSRAGIVREGADTGFGTQSIPYHGEEAGGGDQGNANGNDAYANNLNGSNLNGNDASSNNRGATGGLANGHGQSSHNRVDNGGINGNGSSVGATTPDDRAIGTSNGGPSGHLAQGDRNANGEFGSPNATGGGPYADGSPSGSESTNPSRPPRPGKYGAHTPNESNRDNRGAQATPAGGSATGGQAPNYAQGGESSGDASGGAAAGSPAGSSGGSSFGSGAPDTSVRKESPKLNADSLANRRGRDWGLRYAAPTATPITRPLRIVCYRDRIIVLTEDAKRAPKQIALMPQTRESTDEFVTAVWDEVKSWGIAGKGMYWRPILSFDVHAGGDARFEDFARLLDGSGFEVRRRGTDVARQQPVGTSVRPQR